MAESFIPVDPFTEVMFCKDSDEYPFTDFTQIQFRGDLDEEAMAQAWDEALQTVPLFSCHLHLKRRGLFELPVWKVAHEPNLLRFEDCRQIATEPFDPMAFSMKFHRERIEKRMDLFKEFPFQGFFLRIFSNRWILSIVYQHSVVDPNKAYKVLTRLLALYHEKVKGAPPKWASAIGMASLKNRGQELWKSPWHTGLTFPAQYVKSIMSHTGWKRTEGRIKIRPIASENLRDYTMVRGRHGLRLKFDDWDFIQALLARAKDKKASFNDVLMAVSQQVITEWNQKRKAPNDWFHMVLATSLKGRAAIADSVGTGLSALSFVARGNKNMDEGISFFRDYRRDLLKKHFDINAYEWASKWYSVIRLLPFRVRSQRFAKMLTSSPITFNLSNVGVVWPKMVDGRPSNDSAVLGAGDLEIEDIHSCPTFGPNTSLGLVVRMHNRRLYMNFVCDRFRFTDEEAQELVNAMSKGLENSV